MSTTTGADSAPDLDAIAHRAGREHLAPCPMGCGCVYSDDADRWDCACGGPCCDEEWDVDTAVLRRPESGERARDTTALIDRIRRLESDHPRPRVISGDVEEVTAALDGLPVGSIITCDANPVDLLTYQCLRWRSGTTRWYEVGCTQPVSSTHIARHQVPITVLREGTGS